MTEVPLGVGRISASENIKKKIRVNWKASFVVVVVV